MFTLLRWAFSLVIFAIVAWFATTVPLGKRTLWGHLRAISSTPEAKELAEGTRDEARRMAERLREEMHREGVDAGGPRDAGPPKGPSAIDPHAGVKPLDPVTPREQRALDRMLRERSKAARP